MAGDSGIPGHLPHQLAAWWEHGEGAAKIGWGTPGSFMRCVRLAESEAHMTPERAKGFCAERHHAATGKWPGEHDHHGRFTVSEPAYDADGLDQSWDDDGDLPDLTGLTVDQLEAADTETGGAPETPAQRAMPKLGTGRRFAKLKGSLAAKGAKDPGALAAYIGRKKFGRAKFTKLAAKARGGSGRAESLAPFTRSVPLEDISIRSGGDGRVVEAYAAVFNTPTDIGDQDGEYTEILDPSVFNKAIADAAPQGTRKAWRIGVFYNHGRTIMGTPAERYSMPIGKILDIKADDRGLWTEIRYNRTPVADEVLENIREGSPGGYSFSGMFRRSSPLIPRGGFHRDHRTGQLPVVHRTESTLKELGWTPFPAYPLAEVTGMRAEQLLGALAADPEFAQRMLGMLSAGTPGEPPSEPGTPDWEPPPVSRPTGHSARSVRQEMQAARSAFLQRHRRQ